MTELDASEVSALNAAVESCEKNGSRVRTSWVLITGAPGSGKTTLASMFARDGWLVAEDPGRAEFIDRLKAGQTPAEVRSQYMDFQERVLSRAMDVFARTAVDTRAIFDYGVAEALAFMKVAGLSWPNHFLQAAARYKFSCIFLLDPLPVSNLEADEIRAESESARAVLRHLFGQIYTALGHNVGVVPVMSVTERYRESLNLMQDVSPGTR